MLKVLFAGTVYYVDSCRTETGQREIAERWPDGVIVASEIFERESPSTTRARAHVISLVTEQAGVSPALRSSFLRIERVDANRATLTAAVIAMERSPLDLAAARRVARAAEETQPMIDRTKLPVQPMVRGQQVPAVNPRTQPATMLVQERNASAVPEPDAADHARPAMGDPHHTLPASYFASLPQPGPPPAHLIAEAAFTNYSRPSQPGVAVPPTLGRPGGFEDLAAAEQLANEADALRVAAEARAETAMARADALTDELATVDALARELGGRATAAEMRADAAEARSLVLTADLEALQVQREADRAVMRAGIEATRARVFGAPTEVPGNVAVLERCPAMLPGGAGQTAQCIFERYHEGDHGLLDGTRWANAGEEIAPGGMGTVRPQE